jgi:hypothetical protein
MIHENCGGEIIKEGRDTYCSKCFWHFHDPEKKTHGRHKSLGYCKNHPDRPSMPRRNLCHECHLIKAREVYQRNKHKYKEKRRKYNQKYYQSKKWAA